MDVTHSHTTQAKCGYTEPVDTSSAVSAHLVTEQRHISSVSLGDISSSTSTIHGNVIGGLKYFKGHHHNTRGYT